MGSYLFLCLVLERYTDERNILDLELLCNICILSTGEPTGLELIIPDCCEDEDVIPQKKYFGGQEGVGEYVWYQTKNKLDGSSLMDISDTCDGVVTCGKTL